METLSFENLVETYYNNLVNTLRNFCPGPSFLETWVHDEASDKSIYALFEAAKSAGLQELSLEVLNQTLSSELIDILKNDLEQLGQVSISPLEGKSIWTLKFGFACVVPAYLAALKRANQTIHNQGVFKVCPDNLDIFMTQSDGVFLSCLVDSKQSVIQAKHIGATGYLVPLLDQFCDLIRNIPLQEAAEHGLIRLERQLRDRNLDPPAMGVVTPDNADPIFATAQKLIRKIHSNFLLKNGLPNQRNTWTPRLSEYWISLNHSERLKEVQTELRQICLKLGLNYDSLEVVAIKNETRIVLSGHDYLRTSNFGHHLMKIEVELQAILEPELELVLESLEDRNKRKTHAEK